jgi:molybdopterin-guanine dinucleotide biosynthesis protein A
MDLALPSQPTRLRLAAVLLAGGGACRFNGTPKALLHLPDGRTIIARLIEVVCAVGIEDIIISANDPAPYKRLDLPIVPDRRPEAGPLAGIEAALHHFACCADAVLVLASDLANLRPEDLSALLSSVTGNPPDVTVAVRAEWEGERSASARPSPPTAPRRSPPTPDEVRRMEPLIAVLSTALGSALTDFLDRGGRRVRVFYAAHRPALVPLRPAAFTNINSPADLAALRAPKDKSDLSHIGPDRP